MAVTGALLTAAGTVLMDPPTSGLIAPEVLALLQALACPMPAVPGPAERHRARLFLAAGRFRRLFRLRSKVAPGLQFFGAEVSQEDIAGEPGHPMLSVAGSGLRPLEAFESCVGEAIERLSAVETAADRARRHPGPAVPESWLAPLLASAVTDAGWLPAHRITDGTQVMLPVDLCLSRAPSRRVIEAPWPLSTGCAAGATREGATLRALLELVERDAVALWWRGGRPAAPVAVEEPALAAAAALLESLRAGRRGRRSWMLDITTEIGVPVVAAVSFAAGGEGFCFGAAARPSLRSAACAALLELAQIELAVEVVETKRREGGTAALSASDHRHLRRFEAIHAARCAAVHPRAPARAAPDLPEAEAEALGAVLGRLSARSLEPLLVDLTRPDFGVPVVRALCPGLEAEPSRLVGPRLIAALTSSDSDCQTPAVPLM